MWQLIDRVIQQVVLQQDDGGDPDVAPLEINVNFIIDSYVALPMIYKSLLRCQDTTVLLSHNMHTLCAETV